MSDKTDKVVVSDKIKHSEEGFKYFIGYQEDEWLHKLPQMNGYLNFFENGGMNMSFLIKKDEV